jgi:hypothetical protein
VKKKESRNKPELSLPLAPAEWDFRRIPETQLQHAIYYEYARSCDWILKKFQRWHEQKLNSPDLNGTLSGWKGLTVKAALEKIENDEAPFEVVQAIAGPGGDDEIPALGILYFLNPLFPTPFLNSKDIASGIARVEELMPLNPKPPPFREVSQARELSKRHPSIQFAWDDPEWVKEAHSQGMCKFEVVLDLRYSKNRLKKEVGKWIDDLSYAGVEKFPIEKGKKAALNWFRLRELAAYRFFKAKISHARAKDFLESYSASKTSVQHGSVLPNYQSAGAWSDAVKSAEKHISELFPPPN